MKTDRLEGFEPLGVVLVRTLQMIEGRRENHENTTAYHYSTNPPASPQEIHE